MNEIFIVGVGMTPFGRHLDKSVKQLTQANLHNDAALVAEVIGVLQPVAQGWKEIGPQGSATPAA